MNGSWLYTNESWIPSLWYLNLREIASHLNTREKRSAGIGNFVREIQLRIEDKRYRNMQGDFDGNCFAIKYFGQTNTDNRAPCCAFRWKYTKDLKNNSIPYRWIELSQNPELLNEDWSNFSYFISGNMVYFSLTRKDQLFHNFPSRLALASFKLDPNI